MFVFMNSDPEISLKMMQVNLEAAMIDPARRNQLMKFLDYPPLAKVDNANVAADRTGIVFLIDPSGVVVSQNAEAVILLGMTLGTSIAEIAWSPETARIFLGQIAQSDAPLLLSVSKLDGEAAFLVGMRQEHAGNIVLYEVLRAINPQIIWGLAQGIGLNQSELNTLQGVMAGKSAEEIATELDRKLSTVRQLIKAIMAKMGVHTQQQLISIVYSMALMAARNRPFAQMDQNQDGTTIVAQGSSLHSGALGKVGLHRFGLQNGIPVLFFHGAIFGIAGHDVTRNAAEILGLDVIAPERPGYGNTPLGKGEDPVALACNQALEILDELAISRVVVLGHDIGTLYALQFATRYSNRVAAVVTAPTTPPMQSWSQTADMPTRHRVNAWAAQNMPQIMDKIVSLGLSQIARKGVDAMPKLIFDGCIFDQEMLRRPEMSQALQESFSLAWAQEGAGFRMDMHLTNLDWQADVTRVSVPVLCLHGEQSQTVSRRSVAQLASDLPQGRFQPVADAGHSMPLSHTAYILRQVLTMARDFGLREVGFDVIPAKAIKPEK
ncbi:hypothetical protein P775_24980 [Puniceibacterium antarcticum]|uniref:HTH luxR-type domain-containing protein n=1 Tax=Puniceibacterium antarcticum TaxID=1206336 RepID=A0A2G8R462_9RHOB|nr:alpha/beta fold hydrolase [Puniceibacterium antarcticum]PIL16324.1 hypothetical protein P775_24980 [Puniceibacterium antarcticum]